ncbi:hypothetical protein [Estrella lausannensis]|uniref:Putative membrane protein n=1 Tax=Estrella lausannensis TaxID=483423 RepID=A0A0H5DQ73_9BACT|nr:hypothetical protein [Estrella lausannensis]CRX38786.1 putative membrane protein [Estrella lausannensis]
MICDFNFSYDEVSFGTRASLAVCHVVNIPVQVIMTIVNVAKASFLALAATLTLFQSEIFMAEIRLSTFSWVSNLANIPLSVFGFFAPVNAAKLQVHSISLFSSILS